MPVARKSAAHQVGTPATKSEEPTSDDNIVDSDKPMNLFEELKSELSKQVNVEPYALTVPNRPDMALVFMPDFEFPLFQSWSKKCEDRKTKETDFFKLAVIVMSNTNKGIRLRGEDVDHDGEPMTILTPEVAKWVGAPIGSTTATIRKIYGSDGHVIQAARMIIEKAGYTMEGDVLEDEDGPLDD